MLSAATLVYLAIPFFIFFLGWLRWPLAILKILLPIIWSGRIWAPEISPAAQGIGPYRNFLSAAALSQLPPI
jgi:hypothetical protein